MKIKAQFKGFSLIEIMITLVILAVGILGISKLQGTLIRNSSDANQRTVAVSLVQQKTDDLKSFTKLTVGTNTDTIPDTWVVGIDAELLAYEHIADSKGGVIGPADSANPIIRGNYAYTLDWTSTEYYYTDLNESSEARTAAVILTAGETVPTKSDYKLVTVAAAWDDETGTAQEISLATIIDAYPPALTALADNPNATGGNPLTATYIPEAAPDVINIYVDLNPLKFRQTSKPLPDVLKTGADENTIVSFEVITYHDVASESVADRQEEFITLDCACQFNGTAATYKPAHNVWESGTETRYDFVDLRQESKETAIQVGNANTAEGYCTVCCRDHHDFDDQGSDVRYVRDTTGGNHEHYQSDGSTANYANNDTYVESCRLKRVDGILRVFQDWDLHDITVMDRAELASGQPLLKEYSDYVADYIIKKVTGTGTPTANKPTTTTDISTVVNAQHQLEVRGVYIDHVYDENGTEDPQSYIDYILGDLHDPLDDQLDIIPFSEVNLTLLAHWESDDDLIATVTNEEVATISDPDTDYYGTYSRGAIIAKQSNASTYITASIQFDNDGITQLTNNASATIIDDAITVDIASGGSAIILEGTYSFSFSGGEKVDTISISATNGGTCILHGKNPPTYSGNEFTCSMTAPWTGDIIITVVGNDIPSCNGLATYPRVAESSDLSGISITGICS